MSKRSALCAAISVATLIIAVPTMASAEANHKKPNTAVRTTTTTTKTNVTRTPQARTTTRTTTTTTTQFKKLNTSGGTSNAGNTKFHKPPNQGNTVTTTTKTNTVLKNNPSLKVNPNVVTPNLHVTPALHAGPALKVGPGHVNAAFKPVNYPHVMLANNKFAPIWKQKHGLWWGGRWRYFVPFTALGVALIGGAYYYPDSYVGFARPYCTGVTPEGCQLNWQQVNFEDGGGDWQCVQYCQRPNAIPPPQAVALTPPPPMPQGSCEVTIYSDPGFGGTGVTTGDEQPQLSQSGWQNQIASIEVKSGTWDFFSDENFAGQTMRLQPGPYQDLGPEWTKKIGSFQCIQPGS
jgi:hypothetical protein